MAGKKTKEKKVKSEKPAAASSKKVSVKSYCEEAILAGKTHGVIMNGLRKKFDKDDATYEKSIKYYASALNRDGKIDDDTKAKYVGSAGRGNSATKNAEKKPKGEKKPKTEKKTKK